jgi:hypothetical protein
MFPDEGHEILLQHNRTRYIRAVGDWLADYLLSDEPRASRESSPASPALLSDAHGASTANDAHGATPSSPPPQR